MTPNDVKELLKTLIAEEGLPLAFVDIPPAENIKSLDTNTECRIKDVINQWNKDGRIYTEPPRTDIMEFYTKTDSKFAAREMLESLEVETLIAANIAEKKLPISFADHGFRLITLAENDTSRYPVRILHGGFRLEKRSTERVQSSQLEGVANRFETILKEKEIKAKLFHRGFILEKTSEANMTLSQVKEIAKNIDETLGINYVLNSYNYLHSETEETDSALKSASICISMWRFPRR